jgi:HlyD family secretion protein
MSAIPLKQGKCSVKWMRWTWTIASASAGCNQEFQAALRQAAAKETFAQTQATRYEQLLSVRGTSEETVVTKRQELAVASAALVASREDIARLRAELKRSALNAET